MKFDVITIFPKMFDSYIKESLLDKAIKKNLLKINFHDLRNWSNDIHKTVDERPFGGGKGMVMKVGPIYSAVKEIESCSSGIKKNERKIILFTPRGKKFNQKMAFELSKMKNIIMICGRYEGVDERVAKNIADMSISIGNYDLMGGELPAMVLIETISRLIPGVLGKEDFLKERLDKNGGFIEYVQYTRPEIFSSSKDLKWKVPKVLLSGKHKEIEEWRKKHSKKIE